MQRKLDISKVLREVNLKFGLSRWHVNDDESEAMRRLYASAGSGIAVESPAGKVKNSLRAECIIVNRVRYMNFKRETHLQRILFPNREY